LVDVAQGHKTSCTRFQRDEISSLRSKSVVPAV
jgi:hypothetical protein